MQIQLQYPHGTLRIELACHSLLVQIQIQIQRGGGGAAPNGPLSVLHEDMHIDGLSPPAGLQCMAAWLQSADACATHHPMVDDKVHAVLHESIAMCTYMHASIGM